jgi:hypothetical protein
VKVKTCSRYVGQIFPARLYRFDQCRVAYEIVAVGLVHENFKKVEMTNWTALLRTELALRCVRLLGVGLCMLRLFAVGILFRLRICCV